MDGTVRVRSLVWFATGVMVTLLATVIVMQTWRADAAPGDVDTTFVAITPGCRFADTRQSGQGGPIGDGQTRQFIAHGVNNDCTIPTDAVAVLMNVTADRQTAPNSFLSIWGTGANPGTSALNPAAGEPPTPNAVTTDLTGAGVFNVYNDAGSVDVIIDFNGYYTKASLTELASRLTVVEAAQPFAVTALDANEVVTQLAKVAVSVTVTAPVAGQVTVDSSAGASEATAGEEVRCSINIDSVLADVDPNYLQWWESGGSSGSEGQLAGTRVFDIGAGATATYNLVCKTLGIGGSPFSEINAPVLTAIFTPAP